MKVGLSYADNRTVNTYTALHFSSDYKFLASENYIKFHTIGNSATFILRAIN